MAAAESGDAYRCSIAGALDIVGDKWSLLVMREISIGVHRFEAIARNTSAPRDVLTARLRKLEREGVIERRMYSEHPPRYDYVWTDAGADLVPLLLALREWGDRHVPGEPTMIIEHSCGAQFVPEITCAACHEPVRVDDLASRWVGPESSPSASG